MKARPRRRTQQEASVSTPSRRGNTIRTRTDHQSNAFAEPRNGSDVPDQAKGDHNSELSGPKSQSDTFELVKGLLAGVLEERHGCVLHCVLEEPPSSIPGFSGSLSSSVASHDARNLTSLDSTQVWNLLTAFRSFMCWQDVQLLNIEDLHATAWASVNHFQQTCPFDVSFAMSDLSLDSVSLTLAALAIGAVASGDDVRGGTYFDLSADVVKQFVGPPTLQLCMTYYLQHMFALRSGTSNYAQGIMVQAAQVAHDLGLHNGSHGVEGLQLYLLIYLAVQYCSLTHNTEPVIRISQLPEQMFSTLSDAQPRLKSLIDLVMVNGYIIEHSHRSRSISKADLAELETAIGRLSSKQASPTPLRSSHRDFKTAYEPLARIHMLCCRLKLRVAGLSEQCSWLPSLCICVHAAESILSIYLQLYQPVLVSLVASRTADNRGADKATVPIAGKLPTTWRQVKRIMMSIFLLTFAYWHGEIVHEAMSRFLAIARVLIDYPRWRWGDKLNDAVRTLDDISRLCDIQLYENTQEILPGATEDVLRSPYVRQRSSAGAGTSSGETAKHTEAFGTSTDWYNTFGSSDYFFGPFQDQSLFDPWDPLEFPIELSSFMDTLD